MLKWNIGGFIRGKLCEVGIGGILWNNSVEVLCRFLVYIGVRDLNKVEFIIIICVFEISG